MKEYYLITKNKKEGPFTLDELKEKKITRKTLLWKEGFSDWKKIEDIDELDFLVKNIPPEIPSNIKLKIKTAKGIIYYGKLIIIAGLFFSLSVWLLNEYLYHYYRVNFKEGNWDNDLINLHIFLTFFISFIIIFHKLIFRAIKWIKNYSKK